MEPPYRRIADEIAARIAAGELAPGDRVPSTRQIVEGYGVAMATATKALTELRIQGLVRAEPGVGTVVAAPPARRARPQPARSSMQDHMVEAAVRIADAEGLTGLSMRRLGAELGVPTMSLYRHVTDKEQLVLLMLDRVFAAHPPPDPPPDGWRARAEAVSRLQWTMYRRHPWLAQAVSFTRPRLAPHAMAHTEWTMRALDGHGLDVHSLFVASVMLANYVRGTAVELEAEAQAVPETAQQERFAEVLHSGDLPLIARFAERPEASMTLDDLLEFGLQRLLDGLARLLSPDPPDGQ